LFSGKKIKSKESAKLL